MIYPFEPLAFEWLVHKGFLAMNADRSASFWQWLMRRHELNLFLAILFVLVLTTVLDSQHSYWTNTSRSAIDLVRQVSQLGLIALGATVVILAGGIDLSTGSVIAFSGTFCSALLLLLAPEMMQPSTQGGGPPTLGSGMIALVIGLTLLAGAMIGSLHAWLITRVGLPPFVATLGTLVGLRSFARAMCMEVSQSVLGSPKTQISMPIENLRFLGSDVNIIAYLLAGVSAVIWLLLSKTVTGRHLYALGGNEQAARLSGVRTDALKWLAYVLSAVLSSLVGIILVCDTSVAGPETMGVGYELNAIAASVVGGCSLQGGVGTIPGTLLGTVFLRVVIDCVAKVIKAGATIYEGLIVGVLVVAAVTFSGGGAATTRAKNLFQGGLGLVSVVILTLLSAAIMALLGVRFLAGKTQLDTLWLSVLTALATGSLLLLVRWELPADRRRTMGIVWGVVTVIAVIAADRTFPGCQRWLAMNTVQRLGGEIVQEDDGITVTLAGKQLSDTEAIRLFARLRHFAEIRKLDLSDTPLTDQALVNFPELPTLTMVNLSGTKITGTGLNQIGRSAKQAKVTPPKAKSGGK